MFTYAYYGDEFHGRTFAVMYVFLIKNICMCIIIIGIFSMINILRQVVGYWLYYVWLETKVLPLAEPFQQYIICDVFETRVTLLFFPLCALIYVSLHYL